MNTGALVNRLRFVRKLVDYDMPEIGPEPDAVSTENLASLRSRLVSQWLHDDVSEATLATLSRASNARELAALVLGSPEFQGR